MPITKRCEHGWEPYGDCCCNCKNQLTIMKHPWNNEEEFKGPISEKAGLYVCAVRYFVDGQREAFITPVEHSMCEMHDSIYNLEENDESN